MTLTLTPPPNDAVAYQAWLEEGLTPALAAAFYPCEESWLQRGRTEGWGPLYSRPTPRVIIYTRRDLMEHRSKHKHTSTSEYRAQRLPAAAGDGPGSPEGGGDEP